MATLPKTMDNDIKLFNGLRAQMSLNWQERIPALSRDNFHKIGTMIESTELELYWNEWLPFMLNKIGLTVFRFKMLRNKLAPFKTGSMEYGELIEEIGLDIPKSETYTGPKLYGEGELCQPNPFCKTKPEGQTQWHRRNMEVRYPMTIFRSTLKKAFSTAGGFTTLVEQIIQSMYSAATADEYIWTKQLFSEYIINPKRSLQPNQVVRLNAPITDRESAEDYIIEMKSVIEDLSFNSRDFNPSALPTWNEAGDLALFVRRGVLPIIDVKSLSAAFNQARLYVDVPVVVVDDFGENTVDFDPAGATVGPNNILDEGESVVAMLVDRKWFMIYDNLREFHSIFNPRGLYWNYFLHIWQTYATSYMVNAVIFIEPENGDVARRVLNPVTKCDIETVD